MYVALYWMIVVLAFGAVFYWIAYELAKRKRFFAFREVEGRGNVLVVGEGDFAGIIGRLSGVHHNDPNDSFLFDADHPNWELLPDDPNVDYSDGWLTRMTGIIWIGIFPHVWKYQFKWKEEKPDGTIWPRNESTRLFYIAPFPYVMVLVDAEDKDTWKVTLTFTVTIQITNPYVALFANSDWLVRITSEILALARAWVGTTTYQAIINEKAAGATSVTPKIMGLNDHLTSEPAPLTLFRGRPVVGAPGLVGVTIRGVNLNQVELTGQGAQGLGEASQSVQVANLRGLALVRTAERGREAARIDAETADIRAGGEAKAIEARYTAILKSGEAGLVLRQLDAMEQSGANVVWMPGVNEALAGLFRLGLNKAEIAAGLTAAQREAEAAAAAGGAPAVAEPAAGANQNQGGTA